MPAMDLTKPNGDIWVELTDKASGRLSFKISVSDCISKYFKGREFFVKYNNDVADIAESILYVPAIANVAPVSWAIGANLHVKELDETFIESLHAIKEVMSGIYLDFSCAGDICVENIVSNRFGHRGSAQLFTGGIDSLATYARHRDEKPDFISYAIFKPFSRPLQNLIYKGLSEFAQKEGVAFHIVESNMNDFFNQRNLLSSYGHYLYEASWWASVQHGMGLLGMCAPLTAVSDIQKIYIASSATKNMPKRPLKLWGSHPLIDSKVAWADVKVCHDSSERSRQEKIRFAIKPYIENTKNYPPITVCNDARRGEILNCSRCEKCSRTIVGLALEGIDPNLCGFKVDDRTFDHIKRKLLMPELRFADDDPNMWRDIQACIPDTITSDLYGSKTFFEWLKGLKVMDYVEKKATLSQNIAELFFKLRIIP